MFDYKSRRQGVLSHNKLMFVRGCHGEKPTAYLYVGSANTSEAAWGSLTIAKKKSTKRLICRNWECGVIIPASPEQLAKCSDGGIPTMEVFDHLINVPFEYPAEPFKAKKPWLFMEAPSQPP
jgi:hypothetical protein